jgi:uncharacterized protein (DUF1778 family)
VPTPPAVSPKREALNMRITSDERPLVDRAAAACGVTRTDFILAAARAAAEGTLVEATLVRATPEVFAEFVSRLDAAPTPNARLSRTMRTPAPWDAPRGTRADDSHDDARWLEGCA